MNEIEKSLEEYDQFLSVSESVGALMKYMAFECVRAIKCKIRLKKTKCTLCCIASEQ